MYQLASFGDITWLLGDIIDHEYFYWEINKSTKKISEFMYNKSGSSRNGSFVGALWTLTSMHLKNVCTGIPSEDVVKTNYFSFLLVSFPGSSERAWEWD